MKSIAVSFACLAIAGFIVGFMPIASPLDRVVALTLVFCILLGIAYLSNLIAFGKKVLIALAIALFIALVTMLSIEMGKKDFQMSINHTQQRQAQENQKGMMGFCKWVLEHDGINSEMLIDLYNDKTQDACTHRFAVYCIGRYMASLNKRGQYDDNTSSAAKLRSVLYDAASETDAFLADLAFGAILSIVDFDSQVDVQCLESHLVTFIAESSVPPDMRVQAVRLCGRLCVAAARPWLTTIYADLAEPRSFRRSALYALQSIDGNRGHGWRADWFADDVFVYCRKHGALPTDIEAFCAEVARDTSRSESWKSGYRRYIEKEFDIQKATWEEVLEGVDYVKPNGDAWQRNASVVNERLRRRLRKMKDEKTGGVQSQRSTYH